MCLCVCVCVCACVRARAYVCMCVSAGACPSLWVSKQHDFHEWVSFKDTDVFEITDFTTASEWERFIAQLEEVIHEWKLSSVPRHPPLRKVRRMSNIRAWWIVFESGVFVQLTRHDAI